MTLQKNSAFDRFYYVVEGRTKDAFAGLQVGEESLRRLTASQIN